MEESSSRGPYMEILEDIMTSFTVPPGTKEWARGGLGMISEPDERNLHKWVTKARPSPWEPEVRTAHAFQCEKVDQW